MIHYDSGAGGSTAQPLVLLYTVGSPSRSLASTGCPSSECLKQVTAWLLHMLHWSMVAIATSLEVACDRETHGNAAARHGI